jgi:hypothetical protein
VAEVVALQLGHPVGLAGVAVGTVAPQERGHLVRATLVAREQQALMLEAAEVEALVRLGYRVVLTTTERLAVLDFVPRLLEVSFSMLAVVVAEVALE